MRYDRVSCIAFQVKRQVNKTIENCVVELFDLIIKKNCKKKSCDIMPITMLFTKAMLDYCRHCFDNAIFNVSEICTTFCYARFSLSMSSVEFCFSSVLTHLICEQSPWSKPSTIVFILKKRTDFFFHALMNEQVKAFAWEMDLWPKRCSPVPIKICSISLANGSLSRI